MEIGLEHLDATSYHVARTIYVEQEEVLRLEVLVLEVGLSDRHSL